MKLLATTLLGSLRDEQHAFMLLKFRKTAEAEPFARRAVATAGSRETRLRLALADSFLRAGDQARALAMLDSGGTETAQARARIAARRSNGQGIDSSAKALSEVLTAFAADVARIQRAAAPVGLVQVARFANPDNSSASILLALVLDNEDQQSQALDVLRTIRPDDALIGQVRDIQVRILTDLKRPNDAYAIAAGPAMAPNASSAPMTIGFARMSRRLRIDEHG